MRGRFIRGDGLILPNNVSLAGAEMVLKSAFRLTAQSLWAALVFGPPTTDMVIGDLVEPTIGVNGYERVEITQDIVGWPTIGTLGSEKYIETDWLEFEATGGNFDEGVQRVALLGAETYDVNQDVFSLSAMMPAEIIITPTTDLADRRFKYQFFL